MNPPRLPVEDARALVSRFGERTVLVVGDVMLDEYVWGETARISPEAPVPVVEVVGESMRLGGAANVARNIVSLGGRVRLLGVVGRDAAAESLREILASREIPSVDLVEDASRPTTLKTRILASRQQVVRVDRERRTPLADDVRRRLREMLLVALDEVDGVIVSDYGKGVIDPDLMRELTEAARSRDRFVAVDPKESHFYQYKRISLVTPNATEASNATRIPIQDLESLESAGRRLLEDLESDGVLITRGPEGMSLFLPRAETIHIPVMAREVYDVTGAGDTVVATITLARVAGGSLEEAAILSNAAAGVVVGELGTGAVTPEELDGAIATGFPDRSAERIP